MKLNCKNCQCEFELRNGEYNRQIKKGRSPDHFFCRQACATSYNNRSIEYNFSDKRKEHLKRLCQKNIKDVTIKGEPTFSWYMHRCRTTTRDRNKRGRQHEIDIDNEYLNQLWQAQGGKCAISGIDLVLRELDKQSDKLPNQASLDRIDNTKGYIKGNVRFVCLMINYALAEWDDTEFLQLCENVVEYVGRGAKGK